MKLCVFRDKALYFVTPFANTNYVFNVAHIFNGRLFSDNVSYLVLLEDYCI